MIGPDRPVPACEQGYGLIAAVAAIAVFGALALSVVTATRVSIAAGAGEMARARADAAADAGLAIAEHGVVTGNDQFLALVHGRAREIEFDGSRITVHVVDERGKIPLGHVEADTTARMLEQAGLSGENLTIASDSLQDWLDDDDQPRSAGAESAWYARQGYGPRNGGPLTVDELARVRGFGPRLAERLRGYVTVDPDIQAFDPTYAQPGAIAAMTANGDLTPEAIQARREADGQQVALEIVKPGQFLNRPLTIIVDAQTPDGGHAHREVVIVVTGKPAQPYLIHAVR
ncbi:hypothetical protein [Novosphingobium sp.]|uniref:hypothetical protein n=1 Tax=Novosphingobium sp. TaxID=1874826 RepID=UPI003B52C900